MVSQYHAWNCPACGARVTDLARPEALAPEHRVCERCWRATLDDLLTARLDGERARLVAALEDAERAARALPGERHALLVAYQEGDAPKSAAEWDRIVAAFDATANGVRMKVGEAWDALQAFDAATAGGE